nr:copper oxidase [uncultured bacterium]AXL05618.1 copper oxidase [uncultured bacterium]
MDGFDGSDGFVGRRTFVTTAVLGSAAVVAGASLLGSSTPEAKAQPAQPKGPPAPNFGLTKFRDPLQIPPTLRPRRHRDELTVTMTTTRLTLHSQLPATTLWTYEGRFPGPTIEVRSGKRLRVEWNNELTGTMPIVAVRVPYAQPSPANLPGYRNPDGSLPAGVELIEGVPDLPPWTVVHLHGALTTGGNDGWAHNGTLPGHAQQLTDYPNRQPATTLWYHDHAMAMTRFTVHAGLAGMYLIRDAEEDALGLPRGDREIPLVITDRNLDTDPATGALTGQLLFKYQYVPANGMSAPVTGPFTLVNGVIWPHLDVDASWYRFRVVNAANSRFYRLDLVDEAGVVHNDATRIAGTDAGLLPAPTELPATGLTLTPAERADLLIDFSRFRGQRLRLTNTGNTAEPDIMEFRVATRGREDFHLPERLSTSYTRLTLPPDHDEVFVAMTPPGVAGQPHPQMWELREITDPDELPTTFPAKGVIQLTDPTTGKVRTFHRTASLFDDAPTFFFDHGRWAVWNLIQLGGAPHPTHIHLARFQLLTRRTYGDLTPFDIATGGTSSPLPVPAEGPQIERHEQGWKDTFNLRQGEWLTVAGHLEGATGEFMYHCHILDHEDEGMMRPFVVHPPGVTRFHPRPGGHSAHQTPHGGGH